jgi:hypothetical protein
MPDPRAPQLERRLAALELEIRELRTAPPPSAARSPRRRMRRVATAIMLVLAIGVVPMVALATDNFSDVPTDNQFHDAINSLYDARITRGCTTSPPLKYCPQDDVNRQQMAGFLNRGLGRVAGAQGSADATADATLTVASITLDTGGLPGGTGFVLVTGSASGLTASSTTCPCALGVRVRNATAGQEPTLWQFDEVSNTPTYFGGLLRVGSASQSWVFSVPSGTTQTFQLRATVDMTGATGDINVQGHITAVYVPFGSAGGSALDLGEAGSTEIQGVAD